MCTIFDIHSQKKKKTLPDQDVACNDYESKEFLSCAFSTKKELEGNILITLTGEPDWMLMLWDWEKQKVLSKVNIGITGVPFSINQKGGDVEPDYNF